MPVLWKSNRTTQAHKLESLKVNISLASGPACVSVPRQGLAPESRRVCLETEWKLEELKEVPRKVYAWGSC